MLATEKYSFAHFHLTHIGCFLIHLLIIKYCNKSTLCERGVFDCCNPAGFSGIALPSFCLLRQENLAGLWPCKINFTVSKTVKWMQNRRMNKATALLQGQKRLKRCLLIVQRATLGVKLLSLLLLTKQRCGLSALYHRAESCLPQANGRANTLKRLLGTTKWTVLDPAGLLVWMC